MKVHEVDQKELRKQSGVKFLYFDFETFVDETGVLVPNLAVSRVL